MMLIKQYFCLRRLNKIEINELIDCSLFMLKKIYKTKELLNKKKKFINFNLRDMMFIFIRIIKF